MCSKKTTSLDMVHCCPRKGGCESLTKGHVCRTDG